MEDLKEVPNLKNEMDVACVTIAHVGPAITGRIRETPPGPWGGWDADHENARPSGGPWRLNAISAMLRQGRPTLMCNAEGCATYASFGEERGQKPTHCKRHMMEGMFDVVKRHCEHEGCEKQPYFGWEGSARRRGAGARYCAPHKEPGMVNVRSPRCRHPGCKKRPFFGYAGDQRGTFCVAHRLDGMVSLKKPIRRKALTSL